MTYDKTGIIVGVKFSQSNQMVGFLVVSKIGMLAPDAASIVAEIATAYRPRS